MEQPHTSLSIEQFYGPDHYDRAEDGTGVYTWLLGQLGDTALTGLVVEGSPYGEKHLKTTSGREPSTEQITVYQASLAKLAEIHVIPE